MRIDTAAGHWKQFTGKVKAEGGKLSGNYVNLIKDEDVAEY
ncbi:hypothetical protein [uncultured Amphritea sp.]|nr:hypothetical protein [uncultured Amphritea sp.]